MTPATDDLLGRIELRAERINNRLGPLNGAFSDATTDDLMKAAARIRELEATVAWRGIEDYRHEIGKRVIVGWRPNVLAAHVELGMQRDNQWCNTYGHPYGGAPDVFMEFPLPPPPVTE